MRSKVRVKSYEPNLKKGSIRSHIKSTVAPAFPSLRMFEAYTYNALRRRRHELAFRKMENIVDATENSSKCIPGTFDFWE